MKFGQLIDITWESIFFKKSFAKCGGEAIPKPFTKKSK